MKKKSRKKGPFSKTGGSGNGGLWILTPVFDVVASLYREEMSDTPIKRNPVHDVILSDECGG